MTKGGREVAKPKKKRFQRFHEDVDITDMTFEQRMVVISKMRQRKGFITFAKGWSDQYTPKEKMWYVFWFEIETEGTRQDGENHQTI